MKAIFAILLLTVGLLMLSRAVRENPDDTPAPASSPYPAAPPSAPDYRIMTRTQIESLRQQRVAYANFFDEQMLNAGLESDTSAVGPANTILRIKYALAGRVTAKQLGLTLDFPKMRAMGFKKVVFTNGFEGEVGTTFTWKIEE